MYGKQRYMDGNFFRIFIVENLKLKKKKKGGQYINGRHLILSWFKYLEKRVEEEKDELLSRRSACR